MKTHFQQHVSSKKSGILNALFAFLWGYYSKAINFILLFSNSPFFEHRVEKWPWYLLFGLMTQLLSE